MSMMNIGGRGTKTRPSCPTEEPSFCTTIDTQAPLRMASGHSLEEPADEGVEAVHLEAPSHLSGMSKPPSSPHITASANCPFQPAAQCV